MNRTVFNSKTNKMIMDVNMFHACMIATISSQRDGGLIVSIKSHWVHERPEHFTNKSLKPKSFFCSMGSSDILRFSHRKCNELLFLQAPENCSPIDEKSESSNGMLMFLDGSICINISNKTSHLSSESERK